MKRKCRQCGETFIQVIRGVEYCSGQCERLAHNPVAKFNKRKAGYHKPLKGKGSYVRKWRFTSE